MARPFRYPPSRLEIAPALSALAEATESQPSSPSIPAARPGEAAAARGLMIPGYRSPIPGGLSAAARGLPSVMSGSGIYSPSNLPSGRTLNMRETLSPQALATLGSGQGFAGLDDWGDVIGGVIGIADRWISPNHYTPPFPPPQPPQPPQSWPQQLPQSFVPQNKTQSYMLYGAAGLAGLLVISMLSRRK